MSKVSIKVVSDWDAALLQTVRLQPKASSSVLIEFSLEPEAVDAGLPESLARAMAVGLAEYGTVAGRWFEKDTPLPLEAEVAQPRKRNPVVRAIQRGLHTWWVPVVVTRSPEVIAGLLDQEWAVQHQALLVLDSKLVVNPESDARDAALEALSTNRDWREFKFPTPARVLVAPAVDGDFILVAGATKECLQGVLDCLARAFREAGFSVPAQF